MISDLDVSRETSERLAAFTALLKKWNPKINLVSPTTLSTVETRHITDSAQIFSLLPPSIKTLADFGSGGGFPGVVLAIMATEKRPDLSVTLVESDQRKCSFLRTVLRKTNTSATVLAKRIEQIEPLNADVITARALASLDDLLHFSVHHCSKNGRCLFPKGRTWESEVQEAENRWHFSYTPHKSITDPDAVILELRDISHD